MATLKTGTTIAGSTAWHAGNDGSGSGLDADTVDGLQATDFMPSQAANSLPAPRFVGDIGIDADTWPREWDNEWQYPWLLNGWVDYANGWGSARYRKTMAGIVAMEGLVRSGSGTIFMLPIPYRPTQTVLTTTIGGDNGVARVNVWTDGRVELSSGNNGYVSLCIWFYSG